LLGAILGDHALDHNFSGANFDAASISIFKEVSDQTLSKSILQRASIWKWFYLETNFSTLGLGFALCQPNSSPDSLAVMKREDEGGKCEFEFYFATLKLKPIMFGSIKKIRNEKHYHSHPGESLAASWGITKTCHFL
jgi:hypothetical protein